MKKYLFLSVIIFLFSLVNTACAQCTTGCTHVCYQGDVSCPPYAAVNNTWAYIFNLKNVGTSLVCASPNVACTASNYSIAIYKVIKDGSTTWTYPSSCPYVTVIAHPTFTIAPLATASVGISLQFSAPGTYYIEYDILYTDGTRTCVPPGWVRVSNTVSVVQWSVNPTAQSVPTSGGSYGATVSSNPGGLSFNLTFSDSWIHFSSYGASGTGIFNYTVDNNSSSARTGYIYINDFTHGISSVCTLSVNQSGVASTYVTSSFGSSPNCPGQSSYFFDYSSGSPSPNAWYWDFGDGYTSTSQNPSHIYSTSGTKTVSLTVYNSAGNSNTSSQAITVPSAGVSASFNYTLGYSGSGTSFTDASTYNCSSYGTSWSWNFGDGSSVSTAHNPSHVYSSSGTYVVSFTACNNFGSCNTATQTFTVSPPPVTFSSTVTAMPTWQRAGDSYTVSVRAMTSDGSQWRLVAHDMNGLNNDQYSYWNTSGSSLNWTYNFAISTSNVQYHLENISLISSANLQNTFYTTYQTIINSARIDKDIFVYYNDGTDNDKIQIPVKYSSTLPATNITIHRIGSTSSSFNTFHNTISGSVYFDIGLDGYCQIQNSNSNIGNLESGEFICYIYSGFTLIETDTFCLTKIKSLNSYSTPKALIFIGGWNSNIENDVNQIIDYSSGSNDAWSIARYSQWTSDGFSTWCISQPNTNYTQRNAYCIGLAIEKIKTLTSYSEANVVCHSKAGLEMRTLLAGYAVSLKDFGSLAPYYNFQSGSPRFSGYPNTNSLAIKRVVFLATPHNGAPGNDFFAPTVENHFFLNPSPALMELEKKSGFGIIDYLNNLTVTRVPAGIYFANMTAYKSKNFSSSSSYADYLNVDNDFAVPMSSSDGLMIKDKNGTDVNIYQMFQDDADAIAHNYIHRNKCLNTITSPSHANFNCTIGTTNLQKIVSFINNAGSMSFSSCPVQILPKHFTFNLIGSIIPGAAIYLKPIGDSIFVKIGNTGENGILRVNLVPGLNINDSIKVLASEYESLVFAIDSDIIRTGKIVIPMLKTFTSSIKVRSASLNLISQLPVTNSSSISLRITAKNCLFYQINTSFNQDSNFSAPLSFVDSQVIPISLDTGKNSIVVRFIGSMDTVMQSLDVYCFPGNLFNENCYQISINCDTSMFGTQIFVNNQFFKQITNAFDSLYVCKGRNEVNFYKYGYVDSTLIADSATSLNIFSQLHPHLYSSLIDSTTMDFVTGSPTQYWKTITVRDTSKQNKILLKQYDDEVLRLGLLAITRSWALRLTNPTYWHACTLAFAVDQKMNVSTDSMYLFNEINSTRFSKTQFNTAWSMATFDSADLKLIIEGFDFDSGRNLSQSFTIIKKQPPIVNNTDTLIINENDSLLLPITYFFANPDSIPHDIGFQFADSTPAGLQLFHRNDSVFIHTVPCFSGIASFIINGTHDWLTRTNTGYVKVTKTPRPVILSTGATTFCFGDEDNLVAPHGASYQWLASGSPMADATDSSYTATETGTYAAIVVRGVCADTSNSISVLVHPIPVLTTPDNQIKCVGAPTDSINFNTSDPVSVCIWYNYNTTIGLPINGIGNIVPFTVANPFNYPDSSIFTVTIEANGCIGTPKTFSIIVNPTPGVVVDTGFAFCSNVPTTSINFTGPVSGTIYNWTNNNMSIGFPSTGVGDISPFIAIDSTALPIAAALMVTPSYDGCLGPSQHITIVVNPSPYLSSSLTPAAVCDSMLFNYLPESGVVGTTFAWSRTAVAGISNPIQNGLDAINEILDNTTPEPVSVAYVYTLSASGCPTVQSISVIVNPTPVLSSPLSLPPICDSSLFNYVPSSFTTGAEFHWNRESLSGITNPPAFGTGIVNETLFNTTTSPVTVVYTDTLMANGCINIQNVSVEVKSYPTISAIISNVRCHGGHDGTISASVTGDTPPYLFSIDGVSFDTVTVFSGLFAGVYTIYVRDTQGCVHTKLFTITDPVLILSTAFTAQNVSCYNSGDGSISMLGVGGIAPYTYGLNGNPLDTISLFSSLSPGVDTITTIDAPGCVHRDTITITQPSLLTDSIAVLHPISCYNGSDAKIEILGSGGTMPYTYSDNSISFDTSSIFNGLSAGSYPIIIKDAHNCSDANVIALSQPNTLYDTAVSIANVRCYGGNSGLVNIVGVGGTPPYRYSLGLGTPDTISLFTNIFAGQYIHTTEDANGCAHYDTITIVQPAIINEGVSITNILCYGDNTGSISVSSSGGTGSYLYSINSSAYQSSNDFHFLSYGVYTVSTQDANNCILSVVDSITQPPILVNSVESQTSDDCFPNGSGSIVLQTIGGVGPYVYSMDNGLTFQVSHAYSSLVAGTDTITIKDANNCVTSLPVNILQTQPQDGLGLVAINDTLYSPFDRPCYWYLNNRIISIDTGLVHYCTQSGKYHVQGIDVNGCIANSDTIQLNVDQSVWLDVNPNPSSGKTTIICRFQGQKDISIALYNLKGEKMKTIVDRKTETGNFYIGLETAQYSNATYLIVADIGGQVFTRKFIIQN